MLRVAAPASTVHLWDPGGERLAIQDANNLLKLAALLGPRAHSECMEPRVLSDKIDNDSAGKKHCTRWLRTNDTTSTSDTDTWLFTHLGMQHIYSSKLENGTNQLVFNPGTAVHLNSVELRLPCLLICWLPPGRPWMSWSHCVWGGGQYWRDSQLRNPGYPMTGMGLKIGALSVAFCCWLVVLIGCAREGK